MLQVRSHSYRKKQSGGCQVLEKRNILIDSNTFGGHVYSQNLILIVLFLTSFWFHKSHSKNCFTESIKIGKVTSAQSKENMFIYIIYTYLKSYLQCTLLV